MNKLLMSSIAAAGLSLLTASAIAGDRGDKRWDKMDINGDGELTAEEMTERHNDLIEKADTDGNGAVSREEMHNYRQARRAERRAARNPDKNDDGVVDRAEFINAAQERFDKLDKNDDGVLSEDERQRRRGHHRRGRK